MCFAKGGYTRNCKSDKHAQFPFANRTYRYALNEHQFVWTMSSLDDVALTLPAFLVKHKEKCVKRNVTLLMCSG